jgi:zinc protease
MRPSRLFLAVVVALVACSSGGPRPTPTPVVSPTPGVAPPSTPITADPPVVAPLPSPLALDTVSELDRRVRTGKLANGLTWYVLPHKQPEQRAYLWLAINAGSVQEDDDQRGLAHLVEHMAFNGTKHFAEKEIIDYLEKIGMRFGADVNAFTSFDETVYQLQVPTDDYQFVDKGLDILKDWAGAITFDPGEIDKERGVVLEEWRLGRGSSARVFDKQASTLFAGTRYADRLTIGLPEIITKAPHEAVTRYFKDWYRPDLMAVIVVGDLGADQVIASIQAKFGDLTNPATARPRPQGAVPAATGTRISIVTDPEQTDETVEIHNQLAHRRESTYGDYRRTTTDNLYNTMLNERFDELADRPTAPMTFAASSTSDTTRDIDAFSRYASAKRGRMADTVKALFAEVLRVEQHGFTAGELERAKRQVLRGIAQSARERDKRDGYEFADEITRLFFQGEQMPGREREAELIAAFLPTVTLEELNQLARQWGGAENRVILISGPSPKKVKPPTKAQVEAWIEEVEAQKLEPWTDPVANRVLMPNPPTAGSVTATKEIKDVGVTEWTLSNGIKVVVKPTAFAIDEVQLAGYSPGGTSLATDKQLESALNASAIVGQSGAGDLTRGQLEKLLAGQVVDVDTYIGELSERVRGQASVDDLETMFQLVHLKITAPRTDPAAFAAWKAQTEQFVRGWGNDPEQGFWDSFTRFLTKNHPRRQGPSMKRLAKVKLPEAVAFYKDRFADVGDFTFVIVGNVELAKLKPLVERYLASLPAAGRKETWKDLRIDYLAGIKTRTVRRGTEPKAYVRMFFHADDTWSKEGEIDADVLADALDMRLFNILREDMSGVYGVNVGGGIERRPRERRTFAISFGCAPAAVAKLEAAVLAEIARIAKDGVDDIVLEKLRQQRVRTHEVQLKDNGYWLGGLTDAYEYGDDPTALLDVKPQLARLTNANVKAAAARFLSTSQYATGVLLPKK